MPTPAEDLEWLRADHDLDELQQRFPQEWERARGRLLTASESGQRGYHRLIAELTPDPTGPRDRTLPKTQQVSMLAQRQMVRLTLQSASDRGESGVDEGPIRFRRFDGLLLQRVLFADGLVRKPVSMPAFRIAWRLAAQRGRLMPIVRPRGIYCFYSARFVRRLARMMDGSRAIEVAAGDGTLTRFLRVAGADITATDDHSWSGPIAFPSWVEQADAATALRRSEPDFVVCSWPPAGNDFEAAIFRTPSVRTYVAVVSADPREAGDEAAYRSQTAFSMTEDPTLSALVLPPGRNRVLVFTRR